jgi:hypothetical protein
MFKQTVHKLIHSQFAVHSRPIIKSLTIFGSHSLINLDYSQYIMKKLSYMKHNFTRSAFITLIIIINGMRKNHLSHHTIVFSVHVSISTISFSTIHRQSPRQHRDAASNRWKNSFHFLFFIFQFNISFY